MSSMPLPGKPPCGSRMNAAAVMRDKADRLDRQAARYRELAAAISGIPVGSEAEELLWELATRVERMA